VLKGSDHHGEARQRSAVGKICQDNSENVKHRHFRGVIVILDFGSLSARVLFPKMRARSV
jgi:hypothetical protein